MIATINDKFKEGEHGEWKSFKDITQNVLLEQSDDSGQPTEHPAIKSEGYLFHFGHAPSPNARYRILALETIVVLIQD